MRRWMVRGLQALAIVLLTLYAADWLVMRWQMAHGRGFETAQVHMMLATPLKGQKEEYDYMGDVPVRCSRSIFPQAGNQPCWWLARHTTQWQ